MHNFIKKFRNVAHSEKCRCFIEFIHNRKNDIEMQIESEVNWSKSIKIKFNNLMCLMATF